MRKYIILALVLLVLVFPIEAKPESDVQNALNESNRALMELGDLMMDPDLNITQAYNLLNLQIFLDKIEEPRINCIALKVYLALKGYNASLDGDHVNVDLNGTTYALIPNGYQPGLAMILFKESESKWIKYSGHGMSFEYPDSWGLIDNPTGVVVGDNETFALSIVMHREGCYTLSQHSMLVDFMLKFWDRQMFGTKDGDPITQYSENEIGPHSFAMQIYKNPAQALTCELQGYTAKNVTVTFAQALWDAQNPAFEEAALNIGRLMKSLVVILPDETSM